jgi:hypothetical protein
VQVSNDELVDLGYPNLPCTATSECIVSIGATDSDRDRWSDGSANPVAKVKGSNYGAHTVDIGTFSMPCALACDCGYICSSHTSVMSLCAGAPGANIISAQATSIRSTGMETRLGFSGKRMELTAAYHILPLPEYSELAYRSSFCHSLQSQCPQVPS